MTDAGTPQQPAPMYRRLPHGPSGLAREEVRRNQRSRLYGAMIEAVSRNGYDRTTVAHVIALAGVSRRAFYELFANREECFLGTCDAVVAQAHGRMLQAWQSERGWANRVHASCRSLLGGLARAPKGPRLVLVDALGIGPRARERMQLSAQGFERLAAGAFSLAPGEVRYPQPAPRIVVGGVRHIVFNRLLERRHRELAELSEEVLDWIDSYRLPAGARLRAPAPAALPALAPGPPTFLARADRRSRALAAVTHLTLERGFTALSDPQIARFAGLSTEGFHRQFAGKEECLLAVVDEFARETAERAREPLEGAESWEQGVCLAIEAFLAHLTARESLTRIAFVDLFEAGPQAIGQITRPVADLSEMLAARAPAPMRGPRVAQEAVTGALWALISTFVCERRLSRLPSLADHLSFTFLAPYVGPRGAIEAIAGRQRRRPAA